MTLWLYALQRGSAVILAPLVVAHLVLILIASRDGLSAAEILARTQGSAGWAAFYGLFVVAAAIHGPIGLRNVSRETTPWDGRGLVSPAQIHARSPDARLRLPDRLDAPAQAGFSLDIQVDERSGRDWILSRKARV